MQSEKSEGLDRERMEELLAAIVRPIRANYVRGPISRDRNFEALNALAVAAATIITGSDGPGGKAQGFFEKAFTQQLDEHGRSVN